MEEIKILVVEDERLVADDLRIRLQELGYAVAGVVTSGEKAIEEAEATQPDLVLMDIRLRGKMDGVEAAGEIRRRFDIPTVYLTAYADDRTLERAKISEPFGYVVKPFEVRELHSTIQIALYRHNMELKLKAGEQWLATVLRSISDAVIVADKGGQVRFMNPVAEALTGWTQREALGHELQAVFALVDEETRQPILPVAGRLLAARRPQAGGILVARDGTELPVGPSVAPIYDGKGNAAGVVVVFRDVTEGRRAEQALHRHVGELQARNEELDAFAHSIAHDFQAPLTVVCGFIELLQETHAAMPAVELSDYLQVVERNLRTMSSILSELLLLVEVRNTDVETGPLDMATIVAAAQQRVAHLIESHQAQVLMPSAWPEARGYDLWIEEVWVHLMRNAVSFGGRPPRLQLGANRQADGMVRFWVRDNGPALAPEAQARLFAPPGRLDRVPARGRGLGLSIARRIVEKLGGQLGVESQVGLGSLLFFTLPASAR